MPRFPWSTPRPTDEEIARANLESIGRTRYLSNVIRFYFLPAGHFGALPRFGGARVLDDQSLGGGVMQIFERFINYGTGNPPDVAAVHDALRKIYREIRRGFLFAFDSGNYNVLYDNRFFFHRDRPNNKSLWPEEEVLRLHILAGIRQCETFDQYMVFRSELFRSKGVQNVMIDTHDYRPDN